MLLFWKKRKGMLFLFLCSDVWGLLCFLFDLIVHSTLIVLALIDD